MSKAVFYSVTLSNSSSDEDTSFVLSRVELISFLRKGIKFISVKPLEVPDFSKLQTFIKELENEHND